MKRLFLYLLFCCTLVSNFEESIAAKIRHYNFEVSYIYWSPDCEERMMIGINGKFPGPTIHAKAGDTIVVKLTNNLPTEGVVIHWHGIKQLGTPWADGTASISQCAISPDETFVYRFQVDKAGTYFYHGHYGMQRAAGLYGSLIVDVADDEEPFRYDDEHNLLLSDWWHESVHVQMLGISSIPFRWVGEPQTILINGRGQYNCNLASNFTRGTKLCKITDSNCAPVVLQVFPNKTYRLRIASITSVSSLNLAIGNHKMTVVEADGNYVKPVTVNDIDIYSGESYSVLITTDQNSSSNYWLSIGIRGRLPKTQPALAILNYHPNSQAKLPTSKPLVTPKWNKYSHNKAFAHKIVALDGSTSAPPSSSVRQIALLNTQNNIDGYIKWSINNISLVVPPTPYLTAMKHGLKHVFDAEKPPENFAEDYDVMRPPINPNSRKGSGVYKLEFNSTIDVILQNANVLSGNVSEIHPWHLHGHDFWVLGYGEGKFKKGDVDMFNLKNPPMKNTVVVFPYGWTAIRFVANNPGVWAFHCHIEPHLHMGMGIIFAEGIEFVRKIPDEALACGIVGQK